MNKKIKILKNNGILGTALYLMSFLAIVVIVKMTFGDDIWYDEVFSVEFISKSYKDIVTLTAMDVHPPLYYFYLKTVVGAGGFIFPTVSAIVFAKLASVIPWIVIAILALTTVRKKYGMTVSGMFLALTTIMPQLATYYVEIRMYSFAMMLIFIAFLAYVEIVENCDNSSAWIVFAIFGVLTAYTQYYACIGIIGLYILLFVYLLINRKAGNVRFWFSVGFSVICYIPWIPKLIEQISAVSTEYWIQPLTLKSIFGCAKFIYLPSAWGGFVNYFVTGLMLASTLTIIVIFVISKPGTKRLLIAFGGFAPIVAIILSGYIFTILGTPIFVYRYMIPALGTFYFSIAMMWGRGAKSKKWLALLVIPFALGGYLAMQGFVGEESNKITNNPVTFDAIANIPNESVIITNFDHVTTLMDYYKTDSDIYIYDSEVANLVEKMFERENPSVGDDEVSKLVRGNKPVYFLGSFNSRDDILNSWKKMGIEGREEASVLLERYWFNIYRLTGENEEN